MPKLKKQIFSYSHTDKPQVIRINGIYAEIKWMGTRDELNTAKLDGIEMLSISTFSAGLSADQDMYGGQITLPMVRDCDGNPIPYNDTFNFFPTSKKIVFYVVQVYLDPNE